jgi:hypothetical protein
MKRRWPSWLSRKKQIPGSALEEIAPSLPQEVRSEIDSFMEMVLRTFYGQQTDPELDRFKVSDELLAYALEQYNQMPGRPKGAIKYKLDSPEVKEWFGEGLALTPGKNVLGRIHQEALAMMQDRFSYLAAIPVGLGKDPRLRGRLFYNGRGEMAIVLSLGYYYHLYQINEVTFRAIQEGGSGGREAMAEWMYLLFSQLSHYAGSQTAPFQPFPKKSGILSSDKSEFDLAHFVSNVQQLFVLLHEFGHAAQLREHGYSNGMRLTEWQSDLERDLQADLWAATRFTEQGLEFYPLTMQMRGLFWLFEYYHLIEIMEGDAVPETARRRFDRIRNCIDPQHAGLNPQLLVSLRDIFDHFLEEFMSSM